jgi:LPS export ABC transporter protein LptC
VRWQKIARVIVVVIGLGCAGAVYYYFRPRPVVEPARVPALANAGDALAVSKNTGIKLLGDDGKPIYELTADVQRVLTDNRTVFEGNVRLLFKRNGVPYTVTADKAETAGVAGPTGEEQATVVFRGSVRMKGDDGFSVETEEATYFNVEQRVTFPGAVTFTRGQVSGNGVGAELEMEKAVLWLHDQSVMRIVPEGEGKTVVARGKRIGLAETDRYLRVEEGARLTRDDQELASDVTMLFFSEGAQTVHRIEMDGQSRVTQTGGGDRPDMRADNIDLDFVPETSALSHAKLEGSAVLTTRDESGTTRITGSLMDLTLAADGKTLTRLDVAAPTEVILPPSGTTPARTIKSSGLIAEGAEPKGLDRAVFSGGVDYRETTPASRGQVAAQRVATAESLVLGLAGGINEITVAEFRQRFTVTDGTMTAMADEGIYDAKAETLQLRPNVPARQRPHLVDQDIDVTAHQAIDVDLKQDSFKARGKVVFMRKAAAPVPGAKPAPEKSGLFEDGKALEGNADVLTYSKADGMAVFTGTASLLQGGVAGKDVIRADELRLDDKKKDLTATGNVRSTFLIEGSPPSADATTAARQDGPTSTQLNSARMVYTDATRTAVYSGGAVMDSRNGDRLTADQISIEMMAQRRSLGKVVALAPAETPLRATLPEGRQVTGLHLTYDAETEEYVVTGKPATFISRSATKPGICDVGTGTRLLFLRTAGWSKVANEGGAVGKAEEKKCAEVLK